MFFAAGDLPEFIQTCCVLSSWILNMEAVTNTATTSMVTTVTASTSGGVTTAASTAFPLVPIYKPKFDWTASNLYEQFKLFKQKCTYLLINGPCSHVPAHMQVSVFLN